MCWWYLNCYVRVSIFLVWILDNYFFYLWYVGSLLRLWYVRNLKLLYIWFVYMFVLLLWRFWIDCFVDLSVLYIVFSNRCCCGLIVLVLIGLMLKNWVLKVCIFFLMRYEVLMLEWLWYELLGW